MGQIIDMIYYLIIFDLFTPQGYTSLSRNLVASDD